ncbi:hypothetical protein ACF1AJ_06725 [Leifsonia sp. NPDC014704]|uniref:hypothetical protein n=1 Tax=Leifsonia sp. NPDC014704 TaxID=3364123 RepID=UPI0036F46258
MMIKVWTVVAGLAVTGALLAGTTACAEMGDRILYGNSTERPKSNLECQRESALHFRSRWANVEEIRFKREGGKPGLGAAWSVNAIATLDGKEIEVIIGPDTLGFPLGESPPMMPSPPPSAPRIAMTVFYSNGTSEVFE